MMRLWNRVNGEKRNIGIMLTGMMMILENIFPLGNPEAAAIPALVWAAVASWTGVGVGHSWIKKHSAGKGNPTGRTIPPL